MTYYEQLGRLYLEFHKTQSKLDLLERQIQEIMNTIMAGEDIQDDKEPSIDPYPSKQEPRPEYKKEIPELDLIQRRDIDE